MTTPENPRRRQQFESLLVGVLCVLLATSVLYFRGRADETTRDVQRQADANSAINACLSNWAQGLSLALGDRDAVSRTARAAQLEVWATFRSLVEPDVPPPGAKDTMIEAIADYQRVLRRLERLTSLHPYPSISPCFASAGNAGVLALMAYRRTHPCWGRSVTLLGTRGDDTLIGTDESDVIFGGRGADLISAERGSDFICAGRGDDTVNGGPGRDSVRGGLGADVCIQTEQELSC